MSQQDPVVDRLLQRIAVSLYGLEPQVHRYHSENSYVCCLDFEGDLANKVIKFARHNPKQVLREQVVLQTLASVGLEVPDVEFTQADCEIDSAPFFTMPRLAGTTLQEACWSRAEWLEPVFRQAGRFVARLSTLPPDLLHKDPVSQTMVWEKAALSDPRTWAFMDVLDRSERQEFECHLHRIARLASRGRTGLMHGSFGPAHILCDKGGTFAVIDWENAGPGFVMRDVAHFVADVRMWTTGEPELVTWFTDGFQSERPLHKADWDEIQQWQIFTFAKWANYFTWQGNREQAERMLDAVREHLGFTLSGGCQDGLS